MEKLHIRKIASLGLMLCFFTGVGAQTPVKVEKRKEHKSNTVIPVVKGNVTDTLSLVSFNDFHGAFACDKGICWVASYCICAVLGKEIPAFP